ncbi:hypothetical protein BC827DRAFT_1130788, partial [Russula dissimulans]
ILYYDYFLTLSMEVSRYWRAGSHTWASALFLVLRYAALLGHLPFLYRTFGNVCNNDVVLLVMRVYALYLRSRWILCLMAVEFVAGIIISSVTAAFSCLLVFDLTVFILTLARSIKLWSRKEPFLHRVLTDGTFLASLTCHSTS